MSDVHISLTDPTKCSEKLGTSTFVSYKVNTTTDRAGFGQGIQSVVRRYNDFTWLSEQLSFDFPGVIVPPLPDKQSMGRLTDEFVESRRRALEKFLQRVAAHAELGYSAQFMAFLQADESGLNAVKKEAKTVKARASTVATSWLDSMTTAKPELEKSAADIKIEEIVQYVSLLEKQLTNVTKYADNLVKRSRETSLAFYDFAQGFNALGMSEGESVGPALSELGKTAEALSSSSQSFAEDEVVKLVEPLEEYSRMLLSIKSAMQQRQNKKNAYLNCMVDVEAKQNAYRKLLGVPGKEGQVEAKEAAVVVAQRTADAGKVEFEKVSERLLTEFEVFKNQQAIDIKQIIIDFVNLQIDFNKRSEDAWNSLIPAVEGVVVESPETVRGNVRESCASASSMPAHNFTIGTSNGLGGTKADDSRSASATGKDTNGKKVRKNSSDVRKIRTNSAFTDEEGEGGEPDDDDVEGV
ncbi:Vps5 C terminal like-domain-containing protein [Ochromonadaceae sp. CCMP2298]|nr:Vps5 C terminal like-domain-containing protein [Ochromonadaceae sp. CCMP2298]|mmetsp:Transcript_5214/g.11531  ORF Transcript_5214/g.11531 Transcript_5214/m.11531 type:complete len:467 (+) Transcript_5214:70-1470(+)|eukprot:CAMPEP_0173190260 /NCGR_PEP_ID=MMETSP1141-20130122/12250_1 /TAXON_ID=483371 /ORGANISM="non described non described, Strain CCMP2298" /LENGTH=466 /DNA_ID=CAMNT_0014114357 /DNA_START=57 /DNA_END=1457 /DNA_ORIENTATION=+